MYDKFQLKLESTQVLIGTTVDETKKQLEANDSTHSFHLVDRINMDFNIQACIIPKAADLTKFRIDGHLPVLKANFSDAKYKSLMKLLDFAIPKFNEDGDKNAAESRPSTADNQLSKQRTKSDARQNPPAFTAGKDDLVVEEDHGEEHHKHDAKPSGDKKAPQANPSQRNFEFKFTVDKLQGSLYKADPEGKKPDQLLVDLIAETFYFEFYQRAFDMVADVKLATVTVEDHVEESPVPEFKNLISSEDLVTKKKQDLLTVHFQMVNKDHPDFQSN